MRVILTTTLLLTLLAPALAQDPLPPPSIPFDAFTAWGKFDLPEANSEGVLVVNAGFILSPNSDGVFPDAEDLTVEIEPLPPLDLYPTTPCDLVAIPAGCLEQKQNGVYKMDDFQSCGLKWTRETFTGEIIDLTPFITSATVKVKPADSADGVWDVRVKLNTVGLAPNFWPTSPCDLVATFGNDRGVTALETVIKFQSPSN